MHQSIDGAELFAMSDDERGAALQKRRLMAGIKSQRAMEAATKRFEKDISREAISAAEAGIASEATYQRLDAFLDFYEEHTSSERLEQQAELDQDADLVTFELSGNFGVTATVKGPVSDLAELEGAVVRLLREMRSGDQ